MILMNRTGKENTQFLKIKKDSAEKFLKLIKTKLSDESIIDKKKKLYIVEPMCYFP